jgi:DNA-binding transcriptional ArsR family regulator
LTSTRRPPTVSTLRGSAPVFGALGDPTRLRIVSRLCNHGPMSIAKLTTTAGVTRQAVAKHLRVLEDAGIIHSFRRGRTRICRLESQRLEQVRLDLAAISDQWDVTLARLRKFVEA